MQHDKKIFWANGIAAYALTHCGLGDFNEILDEYFPSQLQWLMAEIPLEECH